jgi:hypothetical protein
VINLGLKGDTPSADVRVGFRSGWFRHIGVAISGAGGAAVVLGAYDLLRSQPAQAFDLLRAWGPTFLIALLAIFFLGKYLDGLNLTIRESFNVVASGLRSSAEAAAQSAEASSRTADALTRLAEQGGKQAQEVSRLAIYAAQEFPSVYERFDRQDAMLAKQNETMGDLAKAVMSLTVRGINGD